MTKICDIDYFLGNKPKIGSVGMILTNINNEYLSENDIVYKTYKIPSIHYFRNHAGYGLSVDVYVKLKMHDVTKIWIHTSTGKDLYSDINQWRFSNECINKIGEILDYQYVLNESQMILKGGENIEMANLRDSAKSYIPPATKNIADVEIVVLDDAKIEDREGTDKEGAVFKYKVAIINKEEYRIPSSVMKDIKTILEAKPTLRTVKVIKKGTGMSTSYTVIPLD